MEEWRGLKMESGDVADLTPPFPADPRALGTTLFEGGRMMKISMQFGTLGQPARCINLV